MEGGGRKKPVANSSVSESGYKEEWTVRKIKGIIFLNLSLLMWEQLYFHTDDLIPIIATYREIEQPMVFYSNLPLSLKMVVKPL